MSSRITSRNHNSALLFLFLLLSSAAAAGQQASLNTIVDKVEQAAQDNRTHYRPYVVTREYRMFSSDEPAPKSEVTAEISFIPPTRKDFKITASNGSSRGETVVRHILENETKATTEGHAVGAISRENYDFKYLGEASLNGHGCHVLQLIPKRKEKTLLEGKAWVDKDTYLVRRVDGEMAKSPSWWLKSVHVTLDFDQVDGMWLQERTKAVADVRMVGVHILTSDAVKIQTGGTVAQNLTPPRPVVAPRVKPNRPFGRTGSVLGAGILEK